MIPFQAIYFAMLIPSMLRSYTHTRGMLESFDTSCLHMHLYGARWFTKSKHVVGVTSRSASASCRDTIGIAWAMDRRIGTTQQRLCM